MKSYGLIVIGGGPGGYTAALAAAKAGKSVCLFEKEKLGGTCLNVGCIPTKYLLDRANALEKIRAMTDEGILRAAGEYSFKRVMKGKAGAIEKLGSGIASMLRAARVDVVAGSASFKDASTLVCNGEEYTADDIIIATGSSPLKLSFPGAEYCIDSTAALSLTRLPRRICIIGGGVIGLELGSAFCAYGATVTIVELTDSILPREERAAVELLVRELRAKGMDIRCSTRVTAVEKNEEELTVRTNAGDISSDCVISAAGRRASTDGLCIENSGIVPEKNGILPVNECLETAVPHIYAIGDVIGGYMLAHAAYAEAEVAVSNILGKRIAVDHRIMPRCVYTITPFAAVGVTSAESGGALGRADYRANGMAVAEGESGCVFAVLDKNTGKCLGFSIVGASSPEMIAAASIAVECGYTKDDWRRLTVAHPSLSESLRDAVLNCQL